MFVWRKRISYLFRWIIHWKCDKKKCLQQLYHQKEEEEECFQWQSSYHMWFYSLAVFFFFSSPDIQLFKKRCNGRDFRVGGVPVSETMTWICCRIIGERNTILFTVPSESCHSGCESEARRRITSQPLCFILPLWMSPLTKETERQRQSEPVTWCLVNSQLPKVSFGRICLSHIVRNRERRRTRS